MPDWIIPFAAGMGATIVGFVLTMIWDFYKFKREIRSREEALLNIITYELNDNINILNNNKTLLEHEISILDSKQSLVNPLLHLQYGFWDLLKANMYFPKEIRNSDASIKIIRIAQKTKVIDDTIRSREEYRIHNSAMSTFHSRMKKYDQIILEDSEELLKLLDDFQTILK